MLVSAVGPSENWHDCRQTNRRKRIRTISVIITCAISITIVYLSTDLFKENVDDTLLVTKIKSIRSYATASVTPNGMDMSLAHKALKSLQSKQGTFALPHLIGPGSMKLFIQSRRIQ
jgi:TRAP-type C4-dicarboxylate transport system permease small subunit